MNFLQNNGELPEVGLPHRKSSTERVSSQYTLYSDLEKKRKHLMMAG
jgi:hypothetical protein